ncbi:MAG: hypothetical protein IJU81_05430 [Bacteroidales bacterium]|nr:hypothetical protein [Bacteroidales bacterium]
MKVRFFILFILSSLTLVAFGQQKKIALLEPRVGDGSTNVTGMEKAMVRGELRKAIVNHTGYEAFTRADIDKLMTEQNFQRTGLVSDDQIKRIGVMSGADYICISTLNKTNTEFYLEAYLVNVESAQISNPASQYGELVDGKLANMLPVCQALAQELLGTISPVVSTISSRMGNSPANNNHVDNNQTEAPKSLVQGLRQTVKDARESRNAEEAKQKAEEAKILLNDRIGKVKTFHDGTTGIVFYASGGMGLAVSVDVAEEKWQDSKKKNIKDVSRIPNNSSEDRSFSAGIGLNYTRAIIAELENGTASAAEWCVNHGEGWYLPSAGELVWLLKVYSNDQGGILINNALVSIGGFPLEEGWYWSSSECDENEAINVSSRGNGSCEDKTTILKVRAVRTFTY